MNNAWPFNSNAFGVTISLVLGVVCITMQFWAGLFGAASMVLVYCTAQICQTILENKK